MCGDHKVEFTPNKVNSSKIRILQRNCKSAIFKSSKINIMSKNVDIIVLLETWLNNDMFFNIRGFDVVRKDQLLRKGGGVVIYLRNDIRYITFDHILDCNGNIEILKFAQ